jgi:hypothetical protein
MANQSDRCEIPAPLGDGQLLFNDAASDPASPFGRILNARRSQVAQLPYSPNSRTREPRFAKTPSIAATSHSVGRNFWSCT